MTARMAPRNQADRPNWLARQFQVFLKCCGVVSLCAILAALLGLPWPVYNWLSLVGSDAEGTPDLIVMMGGGGIPSESGLTRTWQTAHEAARFPKARVLVAMPYEPGENATNRSAVQQELILRGISEYRISQEGEGRYTREQALLVRKMCEGREDKIRLLIVTSPEHVRRSVLAFRKAGFANVRGRGVLNQELKAELLYGEEFDPFKPSADSVVGHNLTLRYRFWDNLVIEVKVARELAALVYYKAKGWI